jgi:hypothetical protein
MVQFDESMVGRKFNNLQTMEMMDEIIHTVKKYKNRL